VSALIGVFAISHLAARLPQWFRRERVVSAETPERLRGRFGVLSEELPRQHSP